jgi:hypothetical protein
MERHEPQREERNKQSRRDEPDEDLIDHLGEPSAEPAQESNELCDVAIEGEDDCGDPNDTKPICCRARGKARIINGFIRDEANSALREEKAEDKRVYNGEGDNVDLAMIFDHEERDVASSDAMKTTNASSLYIMRTLVRTSKLTSLLQTTIPARAKMIISCRRE